MLNKLRLNDSRKTTPIDVKTAATNNAAHPADQHAASSDIRETSTGKDNDLNTGSDASNTRDLDRCSGSELYTPATNAFDDSAQAANAEMERVKRELEAAKSMINQQKRELEESRNFRHTMDQALPSPSEADFSRSDHNFAGMQM